MLGISVFFGIYKNVGYWVPVGPFPWVNFWRICVLDRGANWHLRCFGPPPMKTTEQTGGSPRWIIFMEKQLWLARWLFPFRYWNLFFQLCSNTDQVWGSWFVNPLSEVSKSFYGNQQLLFSPDRWAYHPTHGRPISISLILILVFLGFWNTLSSRPIIT